MRENSSKRPSVDVVFKLMESGMRRTRVVEILIPTCNVFVDVRFLKWFKYFVGWESFVFFFFFEVVVIESKFF
jgi:hypothetical protein